MLGLYQKADSVSEGRRGKIEEGRREKRQKEREKQRRKEKQCFVIRGKGQKGRNKTKVSIGKNPNRSRNLTAFFPDAYLQILLFEKNSKK